MIDSAPGYIKRRMTMRRFMALALSCLGIAIFSALCIGANGGVTPDSPGGSHLEIAFWVSSIGSAFLAFIVMDVLLRGQNVRFLAPLPVSPARLYFYQMKSICRGIGIAFLPYSCLWWPFILQETFVSGLCILLFPIALVICAFISSAVILYTGNIAATGNYNKAQFGAVGFSIAPAVALAVSLVTTLLLKLFAEALMKPGFEIAAVTAGGISAAVLVISMTYAAWLCHKRYYAILASFTDIDRIQINAEHEFVDGKKAEQFRKTTSQGALIAECYQTMYGRRYAVSTILVIVIAVIMTLVLWNSPDYLDSAIVPVVAAVPWIVISRPWSALAAPEMNSVILDVLPVKHEMVERSRIKASISLLMVHGGILAASVAVPGWIHRGFASGLLNAAATFGICAVATLIGTAVKRRKHTAE